MSQLIAYVSNVEKTVETYDEDTLQALIGYGVNDLKTEQRRYVTPINCTIEDAPAVISSLNSQSQSKSLTVAYHAYQSFKPGEVDAETAHEIGIKLANELWGDNFPVVVATHLDQGHIHNHYGLGATGFDKKR